MLSISRIQKSTQNKKVECDYSPLPYPSESKEAAPRCDPEPLAADYDSPIEVPRPVRTSRRPARRFSPSDYDHAVEPLTPEINPRAGISPNRAPESSFRPHEGPGIVARAPRPTIKCASCHLMSDEQISFIVCSACASKNFVFFCGCLKN